MINKKLKPLTKEQTEQLNYAILLDNNGSVADAEKIYKQLISSNIKHPLPYSNLAIIISKQVI